MNENPYEASRLRRDGDGSGEVEADDVWDHDEWIFDEDSIADEIGGVEFFGVEEPFEEFDIAGIGVSRGVIESIAEELHQGRMGEHVLVFFVEGSRSDEAATGLDDGALGNGAESEFARQEGVENKPLRRDVAAGPHADGFCADGAGRASVGSAEDIERAFDGELRVEDFTGESGVERGGRLGFSEDGYGGGREASSEGSAEFIEVRVGGAILAWVVGDMGEVTAGDGFADGAADDAEGSEDGGVDVVG